MEKEAARDRLTMLGVAVALAVSVSQARGEFSLIDTILGLIVGGLLVGTPRTTLNRVERFVVAGLFGVVFLMVTGFFWEFVSVFLVGWIGSETLLQVGDCEGAGSEPYRPCNFLFLWQNLLFFIVWVAATALAWAATPGETSRAVDGGRSRP